MVDVGPRIVAIAPGPVLPHVGGRNHSSPTGAAKKALEADFHQDDAANDTDHAQRQEFFMTSTKPASDLYWS